MPKYPDRAIFTLKYTNGPLAEAYTAYSGKVVKIVERLDGTASIFKVIFPDGTIGGVFWDELGIPPGEAKGGEPIVTARPSGKARKIKRGR